MILVHDMTRIAAELAEFLDDVCRNAARLARVRVDVPKEAFRSRQNPPAHGVVAQVKEGPEIAAVALLDPNASGVDALECVRERGLLLVAVEVLDLLAQPCEFARLAELDLLCPSFVEPTQMSLL